MKILLDECVTKRLKKHFEEFEVFTVSALGLSGIMNVTVGSFPSCGRRVLCAHKPNGNFDAIKIVIFT